MIDPQPPARGPSRRAAEEEQLLIRAAELIELGWCRNALALDEQGRRVEPWVESARFWSPLGALLCASYERRDEGREVFEVAYAALALATGGQVEQWSSARWRTKRHVLSAFGRARQYLPQARRQVHPGRAD